jgi:hypothetical protein
MSATMQNTDTLAPFEIWEVPLDNSTIKFHQPLVLTLTWMPDDPEEPDDSEYLLIDNLPLNIHVFAENREDLLDFTYSDISFVWQNIVRVDDVKLDALSRTIKRNYLNIAEKVN